MNALLVLVLAATGGYAVLVGCSDSTSPEDEPPNTSNVCGTNLCATNAVLKDECDELLAVCLAAENANESQCVALAAEKCSRG